MGFWIILLLFGFVFTTDVHQHTKNSSHKEKLCAPKKIPIFGNRQEWSNEEAYNASDH